MYDVTAGLTQRLKVYIYFYLWIIIIININIFIDVVEGNRSTGSSLSRRLVSIGVACEILFELSPHSGETSCSPGELELITAQI